MKALTTISILSVLFALVGCSPEADTSTAVPASDSAIVGGQAALPSDPWVRSTVALVSGRNDLLKESCTGTLVSPTLVVTAAHCVQYVPRNEIYIHFGSQIPRPYYLKDLTPVRAMIVHPSYMQVRPDDFPPTEINDIALIALKSPAPEGFAPVKIGANLKLPIGENYLVAGYGVVQDYNRTRAQGLNYARIPLKQLWTSVMVFDQTAGAGVCFGDSGGPAFFEKENELILVGITHGSHRNAGHCKAQTELTNATFFKDFLQKAASEMGEASPEFAEAL